MALGFYKYKFMVKFRQTPDKIPSLWHTSGKVIHKIKVCGNVLASFLKFDTFLQCYGNLPLVAKLFAITLPLAAKIGTVLWHRIHLPQSCCNLVATLRQRIFFIREWQWMESFFVHTGWFLWWPLSPFVIGFLLISWWMSTNKGQSST